jgi:hypothetical protein
MEDETLTDRNVTIFSKNCLKFLSHQQESHRCMMAVT